MLFFSDWLGLVEHLSGLYVGSWHEPLRHGVQVGDIQPADPGTVNRLMRHGPTMSDIFLPGPPIALIRLYQPQLLPFLQRNAAFGSRCNIRIGGKFV